MRPKKQILLVDADEVKLSLNRFRFVTHGYRVHSALTEKEAILQIELHPEILAAVIALNGVRYEHVIGEIQRINPEVRTILTSEFIRTGELEHHADCFLGKGHSAPSVLLDWVRMLTARKRGPKKANVPQEMAS